MYFSSVDRSCVKLFLFSTVLLNITFLKIGFIVVQWENENSVSVVKEKKVVGAVELKEGTTVDILTGTNKGRVAIVVSKNCDIRYVIKILSKNRYNGLNEAYITLGATETRIILRIDTVTYMPQFLKLMLYNETISKVSRLL